MHVQRLGALGLCLLAACGNEPTTAPLTSLPGGAVPVTRLSPGEYSFSSYGGFGRPEIEVIRAAEGWPERYAELGGMGGVEGAPEIDFTSQMVVVIASGEFRTGGHSAIIDSADGGGAGLRIHYRAISSGEGCVTTDAYSAPVDLAVVPRSGAVAVAVRRDVVKDCD